MLFLIYCNHIWSHPSWGNDNCNNLAQSHMSLLSNRHSGGSSHQWPVGSHRGAARHSELHHQLSLPVHTPNPPMDLGPRVSLERFGARGGPDAPHRPPQTNITFFLVLHCHLPGETKDPVWSAPPGSQSTGHCQKSAHHMWATAWFCQFSQICWVWHTKMSFFFRPPVNSSCS